MKHNLHEVWEFCRLLNRIERYEPQGYAYWPTDGQDNLIVPMPKGSMGDVEFEHCQMECGKCTNGAALIANRFGGYVAGYAIGEEYKQTLVGYDCGGHDFAVLGNYIVDWWGRYYEGSITYPILRYDKAVESGKFLPRQYWRTGECNDFRRDPCRPAVLRLMSCRDNQPPVCHGKPMQYSTQRIEEGTTVVQFVCPACHKRYER